MGEGKLESIKERENLNCVWKRLLL